MPVLATKKSTSRASAFQPSPHLFPRRKSRVLHDYGAVLEDNEVRNGPDAESRAQRRFRFRIDLQDQRAACHYSREVSHDRSCCLAWAAP